MQENTQQSPTNSNIQIPSSQSTPPGQVASDAGKQKFGMSKYILALITFVIGTGLGFLLVKEFPQEKLPSTQTNDAGAQNARLTVPKDAVQIETCEDNKGTLFVRPQDIPQGPIYMSYKGNVIGIEFMLDLNQVMKGSKFDFLSAEGVKVDHIRFGYLSEGHEGNPVPHFHADLYTVAKNVEEGIKCPPGQSQMNMPGMDMGSSSSASLTPQPSAMEMGQPTTASNVIKGLRSISPANPSMPMEMK